MTASPVSPEAPVTGSRPMRILFALACAVLAAASIANFQREATEREAAEAFVRHFSLDLRRPDEIGAMKYEPAADLAASIAVNASLSDLAGGAAPRGGGHAEASRSESEMSRAEENGNRGSTRAILIDPAKSLR